MVGIDQPWGEYLGRRAVDLSPIQFADALVRARLDLKAIFLEMNLGCFAGGTLLRSEMELNRLLDYWGLLGLPLVVGLSMPSDDGPDAKARQKLDFSAGSWSLAVAAGLGRPLHTADAGQTGHPGSGLEPVRRRPAPRLSPCRPAGSARAGEAGAPHARGPARTLCQSASGVTNALGSGDDGNDHRYDFHSPYPPSNVRRFFRPTQTRQMSSLCARLPTNCLDVAENTPTVGRHARGRHRHLLEQCGRSRTARPARSSLQKCRRCTAPDGRPGQGDAKPARTRRLPSRPAAGWRWASSTACITLPAWYK